MKRRYFDLYCKWTHKGKMPTEGLCASFRDDKKLKLLTPITVEEFPFYSAPESIRWAYWAADGGATSGYGMDYQLTPLRQNILLLMAAMNGEL